MSGEVRPISPASFARAIEDLPVENLYAKALEINNSVAHLVQSNKLLQEYSDSIKNDQSLDAATRADGDKDCLEAVKENEIVIERQQERVRLLKAEVERRGQRWHEAEPVDRAVQNGHEERDTSATEGQAGAATTGTSNPQSRLTDDELRQQLEARLPPDADGDEVLFLSQHDEMRDHRQRPSPITIPYLTSSSLALPPAQGVNYANPSPYTTTAASITGFSGLNLLSPFTPGPPTAIFQGKPYQPTAFETPFTFFNDFPLEIRETIYSHLIKDTIVIVNGANTQPVQIIQRQSLLNTTQQPQYTQPYNSMYRQQTNFLQISRQFFTELRAVLHRTTTVRFDRRWDFINAFINGTLDPNSIPNHNHNHHSLTLTLFPPTSPNIFTTLQTLHISLTRSSDFTNRVTTAESRRVTTTILHILSPQHLPALKRLFFQIDDRSRLSSACLMAFLPDSWFVEGLMRLRQLREVGFVVGPGWRGHAVWKRNSRVCVGALNAVLRGHFGALRIQGQRLDSCAGGDGGTAAADGGGGACVSGVELQRRLGRKMLQYLAREPGCEEYRSAANALAIKVVMLESGAG